MVKVGSNATSHVWFHESLIPGPSCGQVTECYEQELKVVLWGRYCALVRGSVCSSPEKSQDRRCSTLVGACDGPLIRPPAAQLVSQDLFWTRHYLNETAQRRHSFRCLCCDPPHNCCTDRTIMTCVSQISRPAQRRHFSNGGPVGRAEEGRCSRSSDRSPRRN